MRGVFFFRTVFESSIFEEFWELLKVLGRICGAERIVHDEDVGIDDVKTVRAEGEWSIEEQRGNV